MERLLRTAGFVSLAVVGGGVAIGRGIVVPLIEGHHLLDPNLARAVAEPVRAGVASLTLLAAAMFVVVAPRILPRWSAALSLGLLALLAFDRLWLFPHANAAWDRIDRVTGRPAQLLTVAETYTDLEYLVAVAALLSFLLLSWSLAAARGAPTTAQAVDSTPVRPRAPMATTTPAGEASG